MADFDAAIGRVLVLEGGYANHPLDRGGPTKFGITEATARAFGYDGDMKDLTLDFAKEIYKKNYWDRCLLSRVVDQKIAEDIFDCAVNCGVKTAIMLMQRTLNVLNRRGTTWHDLEVDGEMGQLTLGTLNNAITKHLRRSLIRKVYNILKGARYVEICEKRETNEEFVIGWILHRVFLEVI